MPANSPDPDEESPMDRTELSELDVTGLEVAKRNKKRTVESWLMAGGITGFLLTGLYLAYVDYPVFDIPAEIEIAVVTWTFVFLGCLYGFRYAWHGPAADRAHTTLQLFFDLPEEEPDKETREN